jgi:predicted small lipoprotein YifL
MQSRLTLVVSVSLLLLGAMGLAGCGVHGSLEAPPAAKTETGNATPGTPGEPAPHKPSVLDPLIR